MAGSPRAWRGYRSLGHPGQLQGSPEVRVWHAPLKVGLSPSEYLRVVEIPPGYVAALEVHLHENLPVELRKFLEASDSTSPGILVDDEFNWGPSEAPGVMS